MSDLISRQVAIDTLKERRALYCDNTPDTFSKLSYAEKSRVDELDTAIATLVNLPSAEPQERKGHWIDKGWTGDWQYRIDGRGNCWRDIRCSECNTSVMHESNFCPNCGADMREVMK